MSKNKTINNCIIINDFNETNVSVSRLSSLSLHLVTRCRDMGRVRLNSKKELLLNLKLRRIERNLLI